MRRSILALVAVVCIAGCAASGNQKIAEPKSASPKMSAEPSSTPTQDINLGEDCSSLFVGDVTMLSEYDVATALTNANDYFVCAVAPGETTPGKQPTAPPKLRVAKEYYGFADASMCPENLASLVAYYAHPSDGFSKHLNHKEYGLVLDKSKKLLGAVAFSAARSSITDKACANPPDLSKFSHTPDNPK